MAKSAAAALHTEPKEPNFLQKFGHDFVHGDIFTKLSFFVWGLGYIGHGQLMKALLVTFVQGFALYFLAFFGVPNLAKFGTLGTVKMEMVFDVATMKNVVNDYDNSFEILLMSMISFIVIAALIAAAMMVVSSNYQLQKIREAGKKTNNFVQDINVYLNEKFYVTLLTLPVLGVVVFTIVPLFILIAVAFTNYDQQHMPPNELFTWVGLNNFFTLFGVMGRVRGRSALETFIQRYVVRQWCSYRPARIQGCDCDPARMGRGADRDTVFLLVGAGGGAGIAVVFR